MSKPVAHALGILLLLVAAAGSGADGAQPRKISGIGATLKASQKGIRLERIFPGSPAEKAGLRAGEHILEVDGRSVLGLPLPRAVERITGPAGTAVRLRISGADGRTRELTVTRGEIRISASGPDDFVGTFVFAEGQDRELTIQRLETGDFRLVCPGEHWAGMAVIYGNEKGWVLKGHFLMADTAAVDEGIRGVAGFLRIDYRGPGTLQLSRAWNLKGAPGAEPRVDNLIAKPPADAP